MNDDAAVPDDEKHTTSGWGRIEQVVIIAAFILAAIGALGWGIEAATGQSLAAIGMSVLLLGFGWAVMTWIKGPDQVPAWGGAAAAVVVLVIVQVAARMLDTDPAGQWGSGAATVAAILTALLMVRRAL